MSRRTKYSKVTWTDGEYKDVEWLMNRLNKASIPETVRHCITETANSERKHVERTGKSPRLEAIGLQNDHIDKIRAMNDQDLTRYLTEDIPYFDPPKLFNTTTSDWTREIIFTDAQKQRHKRIEHYNPAKDEGAGKQASNYSIVMTLEQVIKDLIKLKLI